MNDEESQQASIPKDYGTALSTVPVSADAGGSARRVVIIALAAIALFASGVAVGSSIATTPRGASVVYSGQHGVWCNVDGRIVPCGGEVKFTPQMRPLSPPSHPSPPNLFAESRDLSCDIGVYLRGSKLRGLWGRVFSM